MPDLIDNAAFRTIIRWLGIGTRLEKSVLPILLVITVVVFSTISSTGTYFRNTHNIQNILANQSVTGLIALAMVVPLVAGYFDLSAAAIAGLSNVTVASLISIHGQSLEVALVAGVLVGVAAGAVNVGLVAGLGLDPFITTLGTYIFWAGALSLYTHGRTIARGVPLSFSLWTTKTWFGIPEPFLLLMGIALVVWFLLTQIPFGRKLAAIGSNELAASLAGIRTRRAVAISYLLSGLLAGGAGALLTSANGGGDSQSAISYLFPALAAVFLGATAIDPGHYNVWGTMFGLFLVAVAVDGLTLMGAPGSTTQIFNGGALVISVGIATFSRRARERRARLTELESLRSGSELRARGDTARTESDNDPAWL